MPSDQEAESSQKRWGRNKKQMKHLTHLRAVSWFQLKGSMSELERAHKIVSFRELCELNREFWHSIGFLLRAISSAGDKHRRLRG